MRKIIILVLTCMTMWACSEEAEKTPDHLLSEKEMALILIDAHIGEAGLLQTPRNRDSNQAYYARYMEHVYKDHKVDQQAFEESYKYYARDPKKLDAIYQIVVDSLSSMEGKSGYIPTEMDHAQIPDSIKLLKLRHKKKD